MEYFDRLTQAPDLGQKLLITGSLSNSFPNSKRGVDTHLHFYPKAQPRFSNADSLGICSIRYLGEGRI